MTKGLEKAFGLPALSDMYAAENIQIDDLADPSVTEIESSPRLVPQDGSVTLPEVIDTDQHGRAMDALHDEALRTARDTVEAGFQADMSKTPRYLEVAAQYYKLAFDAVEAKHDGQMKALKLAIEERRLKVLERTASTDQTIETEGVFVANRNEIIARVLAEKKQGGEPPSE